MRAAPVFASCSSCDAPVVTTTQKCPWCDGVVTMPCDDEYSMQRAMEVTYIMQLATVKQ